MRRRTSLPKLNMGLAAFGSGDLSNRPLATSSAAEFGADADIMRDSSDAVRLVGRKETTGPSLGKDSFPYESGPIEILPGLFLGSEQVSGYSLTDRACLILQILLAEREESAHIGTIRHHCCSECSQRSNVSLDRRRDYCRRRRGKRRGACFHPFSNADNGSTSITALLTQDHIGASATYQLQALATSNGYTCH